MTIQILDLLTASQGTKYNQPYPEVSPVLTELTPLPYVTLTAPYSAVDEPPPPHTWPFMYVSSILLYILQTYQSSINICGVGGAPPVL